LILFLGFRQFNERPHAAKQTQMQSVSNCCTTTLPSFPPRLRQFATNLEDSPRRFALSVSNVPGPRCPVSILGHPVTGSFGIAEIGERHALRIAVHSLADQLGFGLCADPQLVPDLKRMAVAIEEEAEALAEAVT
jgi:hypothetical protein